MPFYSLFPVLCIKCSGALFIIKKARRQVRESIPIIKAKLGDSAGVFGAAYLALREIGMMDF